MRNHYQQLQAEGQATIMLMQQQRQNVQQIAQVLHYSPSNFSRELRQNRGVDSTTYDPAQAGRRARLAARTARTTRKLQISK